MAWPLHRNFNIYLLIPYLGLGVSLLGWFVLPNLINYIDFDLSGVFLMVCLGLGVYPMIFSGWVSSSQYAYIGAMRSVAQSVSYEVRLALILLSYLALTIGLSFEGLAGCQTKAWFLFLLPFLAGI